MSGLRKLFSSERPIFHSEETERGQHTYPPLSHESISPDARPPRLRHRSNRQYLGIEEQFEDPPKKLQLRPSRKRRIYIGHMSSPQRIKRHVDVLEAIFSRQSQHHTPITISPSGAYNEDVAERNLASGNQECGGGTSRYSQVISAIYQEDVADRNMASFSPPILVSPPPGEGQSPAYNQRRAMAKKVKKSQEVFDSTSSEEKAALRTISSDQDIRRLPSCLSNGKSSSGRKLNANSEQNGSLRPRKSAPTFSVQFVGEDEQISSAAPTVNKSLPQAKRKYRTPTESDHNSDQNSDQSSDQEPETRPSEPSDDSSVVTKESTPESQDSDNSSNPPNNQSRRLLSPNTARRGSKRNVRDLSINTKLAAPGKRFAKVSKKPSVVAVAAPPCRETKASLDEIVNSPIALTSPVNPSPKITGFTASEMLNLFKQAYASSKASSSHPTFESLQDAIIREINSHDAFSHISPQSLSPISPVPSLTPGLSSDGRHTAKSSGRPMTALSRSKSFCSRDGSLSSKRNSLLEQSARPDSQGRELSFPAIKGLESEHSDTSARRRRHTYSQSAFTPRVRISEPGDIPTLPARSATEKRPKSSAATGQLPDVYHIKGQVIKPGSDIRKQSSHGLLSKAVSILADSHDPHRHSQSNKHFRKISHISDASRVSTPEISLFDEYDEKPYTGPKAKPTTSTKSSKLHLFIPSRKPARPKHIPIVISDTTTNNVHINSSSGNMKKTSNSPLSSGRRRMPFRIIGN